VTSSTVDLGLRYDPLTAVVTGCASGIGAATAAALHDLGARVVGFDVTPPDPTVPYDFRRLDLRDGAAIDAAVAAVGPVDWLFNCAGVTGTAGAVDVLRVNFLGLRRLTEGIVRGLPAGGAVVSVASVGGYGWDSGWTAVEEFIDTVDLDSVPGWVATHADAVSPSAYPFSKRCLIVYTMRRCVELAGRGIRINCVSPNIVDTPMLRRADAAGGQAFLDAFPLPLWRAARADEQAAALIFLNSPAASYITGANLWTDGGLLAGIRAGAIASPFHTPQ
jgi:NAD(P)-dependent dehydrogenase (short-subunit alcohol dehydrogenase family)